MDILPVASVVGSLVTDDAVLAMVDEGLSEADTEELVASAVEDPCWAAAEATKNPVERRAEDAKKEVRSLMTMMDSAQRGFVAAEMFQWMMAR